MPRTSPSERITTRCQGCGGEFEAWPSRIKKGHGKYCQPACRWPERLKKNCEHCGAEFQVRPSYERIRFCGKPCFLEHSKEQPLEVRFWNAVVKGEGDECWLWTGSKGKSGYGVIGQSRSDGGGILKSHRVSWEIANGPITNGLWVLHKCDVRLCVNPDHLFLGTPKDNTQDCVRKGRHNPPRGEKCKGSRTHDGHVRAMRLLYDNNLASINDLAEWFGISPNPVWKIVNRKAWKHVV